MKIAVCGLWHLGEIYSAGLAELGHFVIGMSDNARVIEGLKRNEPPLAESQLAPLLEKHQTSGRLVYSTDWEYVKKCDVVWITFDTPVDNRDHVDTSIIFDCLAKAAPHLKDGVLLVVSSQLPVGTSAEIIRFVEKKRRGLLFHYAYIPENLRLGEAMESFLDPKRIVIGANDSAVFKKVTHIFRKIDAEFLTMNIASAEMVKHALNSFLATSLSFSYDIADISERVGARSVDVARALRADPRIGAGAYLDASIGFSGGTLGRDLGVLLSEAKRHGIVLPVIRAVLEKNTRRKEIAYRAFEEHLGSMKNKKIAILGVTYKAGTSTLRRSLALEFARGFYKRGAALALCDPLAAENEVRRMLLKIPFTFTRNPIDALKNCHAALAITPWPTLAGINFKKVRQEMKAPFVFFDARNFFYAEREKIKRAGIAYLGVGNGS